MKYAIAIKDFDEFGNEATAYWTTRYGNTDNYSYDEHDATLFVDRPAARCLIRTLDLDDDHFVTEI